VDEKLEFIQAVRVPFPERSVCHSPSLPRCPERQREPDQSDALAVDGRRCVPLSGLSARRRADASRSLAGRRSRGHAAALPASDHPAGIL